MDDDKVKTKYEKVIQFAENVCNDSSLSASVLKDLDEYLTDPTNDNMKKLGNTFFSKPNPKELSCFHASVFEYIYVTLCTTVYYKHLLKKNEIDKLEINVLTTQTPENFSPNFEGNPYFNTNKALTSYIEALNSLIRDYKNIQMNRHFLCDHKKRYDKIVSEECMQRCFCFSDDSKGRCYNCERHPCKRTREEFIDHPNIKNYVFPLQYLITNTPAGRPQNYEIREFIGFKVKRGKKQLYEHCYTNNLTEDLTSLFIKLWNKDNLYKRSNNNDALDNFHFVGKNYYFSNFSQTLENNTANTDNNLCYYWGLKQSTI